MITRDEKYLERALMTQITHDIEQHVKESLEPVIDKLAKKIAVEAVGKWATKINVQESNRGLDRITEVQVNFVEEVINKVYNENTVKVSVND
jgi:carbonic anhydrase